MIKEVPSKVFNAGLDKWLKRSMGIKVDFIGAEDDGCAYCAEYGDKVACVRPGCPLSRWVNIIIKNCCCGLYDKWTDAYDKGYEDKAMKIADKICDLIIERCVYEEEI